MRIIKKYAIGKDDGQGEAIFFTGMMKVERGYDIVSFKANVSYAPQYGSLDDARLFITEKAADDFIARNGLKDSWPVEVQVAVGK